MHSYGSMREKILNQTSSFFTVSMKTFVPLCSKIYFKKTVKRKWTFWFNVFMSCYTGISKPLLRLKENTIDLNVSWDSSSPFISLHLNSRLRYWAASCRCQGGHITYIGEQHATLLAVLQSVSSKHPWAETIPIPWQPCLVLSTQETALTYALNFILLPPSCMEKRKIHKPMHVNISRGSF